MPLPTLLSKGNLVPTIDKSDTKYNESLEELNKYIPIEYVMQWIKKRYPGIGRPDNDTPTMLDRILILRSKTGSGKSSVLPPMLYKNFIYGTENERKMPAVVCTQPRVITAKELAIEAAEKSFYVPLKLGDNIGYQTGSLTEKGKYGITYCTIGILLQQLRMRDDELILKKYRFIVLDEVHERSTDMDQVFYLLKSFMERVLPNPRAPFIILTSATFDPPLYAKFFDVYQTAPQLLLDNTKLFGQTNIIDVEGFAYPIETHWLDRTSANYATDMARIVLDIHKKNTNDTPQSRDILIFLPGAMDMDTVIMAIKKMGETPKDLLILKLESGAIESKGRDYVLTMKPYNELPEGITRRLILSTNVAETGLTIESLKYVLDFGFNKAVEFNPESCISELLEKPAPQSRITQRRGRAGRKYPGVFYPIYTEEVFNMLPKIQLPAILESDFTDMLMNIAAINKDFNVKEHIIDKMLEVPSGPALCTAISKLNLIGFISPAEKTDFKITDLGDIASKFSKMRSETVRMILNGYVKYADAPIRNLNVSEPSNRNPHPQKESKKDILKTENPKKVSDISKNNISYTKVKIAVVDLITLAAIIESKADLMKKMNPIKLSKLLEQGTPKWFCENASLELVWNMCQDELIINLFVFNSVVMALNRGEVPHDWAEENMVNITSFSTITQTRNQIIDNMTNIGLDVNYNQKYSIMNNEADILPVEFIVAVKRAIQAGYVFNTMKLVGENTRPRYIQEYCNSRSEGVSNFRLYPEENIGNIMKLNVYPERVVAVKIGMNQMFSKDGFDEMQPVIKLISVLDGWLQL